MTTRVDFKAKNGEATKGELALPETAAKAPAVVLIQEWWGVDDHIRSILTRLASAGFLAVAPDLYDGEVVPISNEPRASERMNTLDWGRAIAQIDKGPWKEAFVAVDPVWGELDFWRVLERSSHKLTTFYLLSALDLRYDSSGHVAKTFPDQAIFLDVYGRTLLISFLVTAATLLLGYPIAHLLATLPKRTSNLLMILVLLPFSTSILVRTTAWVVLLQTNGLINDLLVWIGVLSERVQLIYNRGGTILAMTHIQLPFTVLPIYSVMKTISPTHMRAARSLGAGPFYAFWRVYVPQTLPGVGAGCLLTFILCLGYYITPALVGGPLDQMVSYFVALYTNRELNWGMASALGAMLLAVTLVFYVIFNRVIGIDKMKLG